MRRTNRERSFYVASILLGVAPFAFGLIRAIETGSDFRYLWTALAACVGVSAVIAIGKARSGPSSSIFPVAIVATAGGTLLAGAEAFMLGARSFAAVLLVAVAFSICYAASSVLNALSRPRVFGLRARPE